MQALAENQLPEVTAEQAARAAEERAKMLQHVEQDLLMDVRRYDHENALKLFRDVRKASATTADLKQFAEAFLLAHGAKIKPTGKANIFKLADVPPAVQREGVYSSYKCVTFDKDVAKQTRPEEVDFIAFGHPLFDAIIEDCKSYEHDGVATVKLIPNEHWAGKQGILFNFLLQFTDGTNQTVREEFHPIFLDEAGQALPELLAPFLSCKVPHWNLRIYLLKHKACLPGSKSFITERWNWHEKLHPSLKIRYKRNGRGSSV